MHSIKMYTLKACHTLNTHSIRIGLIRIESHEIVSTLQMCNPDKSKPLPFIERTWLGAGYFNPRSCCWKHGRTCCCACLLLTAYFGAYIACSDISTIFCTVWLFLHTQPCLEARSRSGLKPPLKVNWAKSGFGSTRIRCGHAQSGLNGAFNPDWVHMQ